MRNFLTLSKQLFLHLILINMPPISYFCASNLNKNGRAIGCMGRRSSVILRALGSFAQGDPTHQRPEEKGGMSPCLCRQSWRDTVSPLRGSSDITLSFLRYFLGISSVFSRCFLGVSVGLSASKITIMVLLGQSDFLLRFLQSQKTVKVAFKEAVLYDTELFKLGLGVLSSHFHRDGSSIG